MVENLKNTSTLKFFQTLDQSLLGFSEWTLEIITTRNDSQVSWVINNDIIYLIFKSEFLFKEYFKIFFLSLFWNLNMNPNQNDYTIVLLCNCSDLTNYRYLLIFGTHWWSSTNLLTINESIKTTDLPNNQKVISPLKTLQLGWIPRKDVVVQVSRVSPIFCQTDLN